MNYEDRVTSDSHVASGVPVIKGTRVTLRNFLASLAEGDSIADILEDFPTLSAMDVQAVIAFAASASRDRKSG